MGNRPPTHRLPVLRRPDDRPSAAARGYDAHWRKLRAMHLVAEPLCRHCLTETPPRLTAASEVDHVTAHAGQQDLLFWDTTNLQSLCKAHHSAKTLRENRDGT